jgi:hypothetical protein
MMVWWDGCESAQVIYILKWIFLFGNFRDFLDKHFVLKQNQKTKSSAGEMKSILFPWVVLRSSEGW